MATFDKVIPPGQAGKISLEIDGDKVFGDFKKTVSVLTNDPEHPMMTITLKGVIKQFIDVLPTDRVYLSGVYGEKAESELTISSPEMGPALQITGVTSNIDDKITYKLVPTPQQGTYRLKIWKNPKLPVVKTWGSITLNTNSERSPQKAIQVNVTTNSLISAQPSIINFGLVGPGGPQSERKTFEKSIVLTKVKGEFSIKGISFTAKSYSATVETLELGKRYNVTVQFTPDHAQHTFSDEMTINTDDPNEPNVKVRLIARSI
ncbi:MAG: hypothetical protein HY770_01565 [Chitinivibrionia bacterium]|nr:hypothetical protein [Chitinivibrionia bacterium]